MRMSKIWDLLRNFKSLCQRCGWRTSSSEDWVQADDRYNHFLCAGNVQPSSFKRIISDNRFIVRDGLSYQVVEASYTAWLFSEKPKGSLLSEFYSSPEHLKAIALYDLSPLLEGRNVCMKLNRTDSPVFQEFEMFLKNELAVKFKPLSPESGTSLKTDKEAVAELA
jgi:hypothetical protein